jgi:ABC-2 type transport system permease protein
MQKAWLVLKNEVINHITRISFWFGAVGVPLLAFGVFGVVTAINARSEQSDAMTNLLSQIVSPTSDLRPEGYVDPGNFIQVIPPDAPMERLIRFPSEDAARSALQDGDIRGYYFVDPEYVATGRLVSVRSEVNPMTAESDTWLIEWLLQVNMFDGDAMLASVIRSPMRVEVVQLSEEPIRDQDNPLTFFIPYAVTMLFYVFIMGSSTLMLSSISKEKETRVIEILLVSVKPYQLLAGKIIGLGLIGLFQILLWSGTGYVLLMLSGRSFNLPPGFELPATILVWGVVFFLLGYLLYAGLMAGVGALVPNLREASQATFVVIMPMLIPLLLISILIRDPNGVIAVGLSLFPLTASTTMMLRIAATTVPLWQILLAIVFLVGGVFLIIRSVAGMFRAQTLLSGKGFSVKLFFQALLGRA